MWLALGAVGAQAALYGERFLDPTDSSQATPQQQINNAFSEEDKRPRDWWPRELAKAEAERASRSGDPAYLNELAYLLYRNGRGPEAEAVWKDLLQREPKHFATLATLGTVRQNQGRHTEAAALLRRAAAEKPADFRAGAELWQARMAEFQAKGQEKGDYATDYLFLEELTPVWKARQLPSAGGLTKWSAPGPPGLTSASMAELLRAWPRYGEAWLVMGMLLEREGEPYLAFRSYERALKFGTGQRLPLRTYLDLMKASAKEADPARATATALKRFFVFVAGLGVLLLVGRFLARIYQDLRASKKKPSANKRRLDEWPPEL